MGGFHSRKDWVSQMLKRMFLLVVGMFLMGCAEDSDSYEAEFVSGSSVKSQNSLLSGTYQISANINSFNTSTTPIRIYTNNATSWTLTQVYHVVAPALPRGTYSSRSKSATLFLSDRDVAAVTAALAAGLYVSIILENPTSSVIKAFTYGETEIVFP